MIDTLDALKQFLKTLPEITWETPDIFIDLEGNNLSRHGTLSLITILIASTNKVYLIDIHILGKPAFTTSDPGSQTLQQLLESKHVEKVFFDVRSDSDALFALYGVALDGIHDLQLMELGARRSAKTLVNGLARCIERDMHLTGEEHQAWKAAKDQGNKLFAPERGGSYAVFDQRPLPEEILKYCVQDVVYMPTLFKVYNFNLSEAWEERVREETVARIQLSQSPGFQGQGRHMALGPAGWQRLV